MNIQKPKLIETRKISNQFSNYMTQYKISGYELSELAKQQHVMMRKKQISNLAKTCESSDNPESTFYTKRHTNLRQANSVASEELDQIYDLCDFFDSEESDC